jgi:uncharacterized protein (TIGR02145 family)
MNTITNYTIKSELGQGGMATVYLAEDKKFLTNVAVKVLSKEFAHNENIRKRFLAEARNMFRMSHPNIIKVTDLIEEGDTVAFVMEYIEGETLKDYLERKGKLNDDEIKAIFTQMLAAVGYVHEQGLIHRDIKPSNFMISPKGQVKLLDFGIAKNTDSNSAEYTQTSTSQQMGTPMYMSPEQVNETKSVTAQSDIYSLGVVLWQMVMGQKPYDTKTLSNFQLQSKIVNENLALTNTNWDTSIQKATHKNLDSRYTSAQLFLNDLQNPAAVKIDKTAFEKNDDKTIFENKEEATIIENTKAQTITPKVEKAQPTSNTTASNSKDTGGFPLIASAITFVISLIVGYAVYEFVLGDPSNFDNDGPNKGLPENFFGYMYKFGFIVPFLLGTLLTVLVLIIKKKLTGIIAGVIAGVVLLIVILIATSVPSQEKLIGIDDKRSELGKFDYYGFVSGGLPNGKGTATYYNGAKYEGGYKDGLREGSGTWTYANGTICEGEFKNNTFYGHFIIIEKNGETSTANFISDYPLIEIGNQGWMQKNLNEDKFRNGDPIPEARDTAEWRKAGENQQPAWCYYDNDASNGTKYGKLYNWYAVNDARGLAPEGWHIPTDAEWTTLTDFLGGEEIAGTKMKSTSGWNENGNGTNSSGFSGLPGGNRNYYGSFYYIGEYGFWWSSSEGTTYNAWGREMNYGNGNVFRFNIDKSFGFSVRCLRD